MNQKVKPNEKKSGKADGAQAVKRNRSKSLERVKSSKKLADNKSDRAVKGQRASSIKQQSITKERKPKNEVTKKLARASSVKSLIDRSKNNPKGRPRSDHKEKPLQRNMSQKLDPKTDRGKPADRKNLLKALANPVKQLKGKQASPKNAKKKAQPEKDAKREPSVVVEEKELGLTYLKPEFDKLLCEPLELTDEVYDKYFDMISNDNDTYYVLNAVPEIKEYRKEEDEKKRSQEPVLTGKMSKISGLFEQLTVDKVSNAIRNRPIYFENKVKLTNLKLVLFTKFKVSVDIGFLQYTIEGDKILLLRLYLSKIYRKMNYLAYVLTEAMRQLCEKHATLEKCCMFLHEKNLNIVKFFKYLGFKIERILTDSKSQKVDYFQEFVCRRKEFLAASAKLQ